MLLSFLTVPHPFEACLGVKSLIYSFLLTTLTLEALVYSLPFESSKLYKTSYSPTLEVFTLLDLTFTDSLKELPFMSLATIYSSSLNSSPKASVITGFTDKVGCNAFTSIGFKVFNFLSYGVTTYTPSSSKLDLVSTKLSLEVNPTYFPSLRISYPSILSLFSSSTENESFILPFEPLVLTDTFALSVNPSPL